MGFGFMANRGGVARVTRIGGEYQVTARQGGKINAKPAGRPRTVSRKGKGGSASVKKARSNVKKPVVERRKKVEKTQEKVRITMVRKNSSGGKKDTVEPGRTRNNPIVHEAIDLLRTYGYDAIRVTEPKIPINIVAMKKSGDLLVLAVRSRLPVPNAVKLRELFTKKVDYLRRMVGRVRDRIMIWVYSPQCGWRYYLVYPGGLRYDLDFPASIA
jgi:hypothetical protein